ncbi:MAG: FecR domain-containing protein [Pseudomonadota bacterium]
MKRDDTSPSLLAEEQTLARDLDALWRASEPPVHFADRVIASWAVQQGSAPAAVSLDSRRRWLVPTALAAAAALIVVVGAGLDLTWPSRGQSLAAERAELKLGHRAVVVAEGGASLSWKVGLGGAVEVEQTEGDVFYRVEHGRRFEVQTPAGVVGVRGTCFRVLVRDAAAAPAPAGSGGGGSQVEVTVYEGRVELASQGVQLSLEAGQHALATSTQAPKLIEMPLAGPKGNHRIVRDRVPLLARLEAFESQLKSLSPAQSPPVLEELAAVRGELAQVRQELVAEREMRLSVEGEARPFPDDLNPRYLEPELKRAFHEALARSGIQGEIQAIDCGEYPCVVYGEVHAGPEDGAFDRSLHSFTGALKQNYPEGSNALRVWAAQQKRDGHDGAQDSTRNLFGIAVMPVDGKGPDAPDQELARRLMYRNNQYLEASLDP